MALALKDEPSQLRLLFRDLHRHRAKIWLVGLIFVVNLGVLIGVRGHQVAVERSRAFLCVAQFPLEQRLAYFKWHEEQARRDFICPWEWSAEEWRESWPWR
ncbi:MAG TPA: hypothetical protein VFF73_08065 [Planctomycetota bacterium]|nr:hypothetical protein [Planctomycetota bacterium]